MRILAIFLLFSFFAKAEYSSELLMHINTHLAKVNSMTVKFRQSVSGSSTQEHGVIYFKKNEGVLIQYETMPISVLINKSAITYYDSKNNQKSQVPTKSSATRVFTESLKITEDKFDIKTITKSDEAIIIDCSFKDAPEEGQFKVYFSVNDFTLRRVDITSPEGETLIIDLHSHSEKAIDGNRLKAINIEKKKL